MTFIFIETVISYLKDYLFSKAKQELIINLQCKIIDQLLSYPLNFFSNKQTGYILSRVRRDVQGIEDILSLSLVLSLTDILRLVVGMAILLKLNSHLAIICFSVAPFYILHSLYFARGYKIQSGKVMEGNANAEKTLSDIFMGIRMLKENAKEESAQKRALEVLQAYSKESLKEEKVLFSSTNLAKLFAYIGELILLYFGIKKDPFK